MRKLLLIVLAATLGLGGCTSAPPPVSEPASEPAPTIPWGNYPPDTQRIIDEDAAAGNCEGLQDAFDVWADSNSTFIERYGEGNAKIMMYIDEALESAGCYD